MIVDIVIIVVGSLVIVYIYLKYIIRRVFNIYLVIFKFIMIVGRVGWLYLVMFFFCI